MTVGDFWTMVAAASNVVMAGAATYAIIMSGRASADAAKQFKETTDLANAAITRLEKALAAHAQRTAPPEQF